MAASIAARSSFLRPFLRTATTRISFSAPNPGFILRPTRISPPSLSRLIRRELSTLQPVHSAIASACLVSKLPHDATCAEASACRGGASLSQFTGATSFYKIIFLAGSPQVLDRLLTAMKDLVQAPGLHEIYKVLSSVT